MPSDVAIVWFRNDLRVEDHAALSYALAHHRHVVCLYVHGHETFPDESAAAAWRAQALADLSGELDGALWVSRTGLSRSLQDIQDLHTVSGIYWNREYDPVGIERDTGLKKTLPMMVTGAIVKSFPGDVLIEPWTLLNKQHSPYKVFSAFYRQAMREGHLQPRTPEKPGWTTGQLIVPPAQYRADSPKFSKRVWARRVLSNWDTSRAAALTAIQTFRDEKLSRYSNDRDHPAKTATSGLSPYLAHGQIGPRELVNAVAEQPGSEAWIRQLAWRDFAKYVLFHWPNTTRSPLDERFNQMPWEPPGPALIRWQCGETGVPLVDAGMRELWQTGYMHNRVRMITASYLTKHLLIDWRFGAEWFMHTLLDADIANNTLGWQWTAGCGVDAAPYFRIFNPSTQGHRFDSHGHYVRRWIPELRQRPNKTIHSPQPETEKHGTYPTPVVDLAFGRERALTTWACLKERTRG